MQRAPKAMPKRVVQLPDLVVRNAKRAKKAYKLSDGGGMYLEVMPAGSKFGDSSTVKAMGKRIV
ncbi:MAG: Arm DNA-binding domain-containing protein [Pseudomonas sp.]|nr:Arm DNA-binding domain-containing protein [Pseudomonas sp.]